MAQMCQQFQNGCIIRNTVFNNIQIDMGSAAIVDYQN